MNRRTMQTAVLVVALAVAGALSGGLTAPDRQLTPARSQVHLTAATPASITGPILAAARPGDPSHNYPFYATPFDLKRNGYVEQEFFISGTATRFPASPTVDQQRVAATPIGSMAYTTRIVVRRPISPGRSAHVAVVDWQNVTAGHDIDTEWGTSGDFF